MIKFLFASAVVLLALYSDQTRADQTRAVQTYGPYTLSSIRVIDGDTLEAYVNPWPYVYIKTHIRIIGIDTPELSAKTDCEKTLALQAKLFLEIVLKDAKVVSAYHMRPDPYPGRMDASVTVDGGDLSDRILASGQARPYDGKGKRLVGGWCIGS